MDRQGSGKPGGEGSSASSARVGDVDAAEFAEYLRAERERRRLTLEQVADETKIAPRHLEALERGDVRNWPGGMYRRAMMRAYAESIGVDREYALKQFEQAFEPAAKPAEAPPPQPAPRRALLQSRASDLLQSRLSGLLQSRSSDPQQSQPLDQQSQPSGPLQSQPSDPLQSQPSDPLQSQSGRPRLLQSRPGLLQLRPGLLQWRPSRGHVRAAAVALVAVVAFIVVWKVAASLTSGNADSNVIASNVANTTAVASTPAATDAVASAAGADARDAALGAGPRDGASRAATRGVARSASLAPASGDARRSSNPQPAVLPAGETAATTGASEPRTYASEGQLIVTSDPPGARVTVNGIGWGETPVTIRHLELGEKRIRLTMQGYMSQEKVVRLAPDRASANVRATLRERGEVTPGR